MPDSVTRIGDSAFSGCASLTEAKLPKKLSVDKAKIFPNCPKLRAGGCYVATAVYGSYDCPEVWTLRRFRGQKLATTLSGRLFIRCYYAISPRMVRLFGGKRWFSRFWRQRLDRLVARLKARGYDDTPYRDN